MVFCTKHNIGRINNKHERCLRLIQQTLPLILKYFLRIQMKNQSTKNAENSIWSMFVNTWMVYLLISWVTSLNSEKIPIIWEIFIYLNLRTKKFGLDSIAYRASQLWKNVPEEIRNSTSLPMFKRKIKKVPLISCPCNCSRKYIHLVGFILSFYIFNLINLSTSCSPEFRINLALYI